MPQYDVDQLIGKVNELTLQREALTKRVWMLQRLVDAHNFMAHQTNQVDNKPDVPGKEVAFAPISANNLPEELFKSTEHMTGHLRQMCLEIQANARGTTIYPWKTLNALSIYQDFLVDLRPLVQLVDQQEHPGDSEDRAKLHAMILGQRSLMRGWNKGRAGYVPATYMASLQHNQQHSHDVIYKAHLAMLAAADLSPAQKQSIANEVLKYEGRTKQAAADRKRVVGLLHQALQDSNGPLTNPTASAVLVATFESRLNVLRKEEDDALTELVCQLLGSELLDLEQSARLQATSANILIDVVMLGQALLSTMPGPHQPLIHAPPPGAPAHPPSRPPHSSPGLSPPNWPATTDAADLDAVLSALPVMCASEAAAHARAAAAGGGPQGCRDGAGFLQLLPGQVPGESGAALMGLGSGAPTMEVLRRHLQAVAARPAPPPAGSQAQETGMKSAVASSHPLGPNLDPLSASLPPPPLPIYTTDALAVAPAVGPSAHVENLHAPSFSPTMPSIPTAALILPQSSSLPQASQHIPPQAAPAASSPSPQSKDTSGGTAALQASVPAVLLPPPHLTSQAAPLASHHATGPSGLGVEGISPDGVWGLCFSREQCVASNPNSGVGLYPGFKIALDQPVQELDLQEDDSAGSPDPPGGPHELHPPLPWPRRPSSGKLADVPEHILQEFRPAMCADEGTHAGNVAPAPDCLHGAIAGATDSLLVACDSFPDVPAGLGPQNGSSLADDVELEALFNSPGPCEGGAPDGGFAFPDDGVSFLRDILQADVT